MRILIGLLIALSCQGRAHAASSPILLSYGEVMQLSSEARIKYLNDLGELLALMEEKFEGRYQLAANDDSRHMRDQVASLMQMIRFMPEAEAAPAATTPAEADYSQFKPQWTGKEFSCGNDPRVVFDARVATCALLAPKISLNGKDDIKSPQWKAKCPEGAHTVDVRRPFGFLFGTSYCIPQASWDALSEPAKRKLGDGRLFDKDKFEAMKDADKAALVGSTITDEPQGLGAAGAVGQNGAAAPKPGQGAVPAQCKTPKINSPEYKKLVTDFRADALAEKCIAGGFFTEKKQNMTKAACEKRTAFPDPAIDGKQMKCGANEVLCNPSIFCLQIKGVEFKKDGKVGKSDILQAVCVKDTPRLTRDCNAGYKARLAGKAKARIANKKPEACDPATLDIPFLRGRFMDEFRKLKTDTENYFAKHCTGNDKGFLPLFCEECEIVGKRLAGMPAPRRVDGGTTPKAGENAAPAATSGTAQ